MSVRIGECRLCKTQKVELKEHHVVEYLDKEGKKTKINALMRNKKRD